MERKVTEKRKEQAAVLEKQLQLRRRKLRRQTQHASSAKLGTEKRDLGEAFARVSSRVLKRIRQDRKVRKISGELKPFAPAGQVETLALGKDLIDQDQDGLLERMHLGFALQFIRKYGRAPPKASHGDNLVMVLPRLGNKCLDVRSDAFFTSHKRPAFFKRLGEVSCLGYWQLACGGSPHFRMEDICVETLLAGLSQPAQANDALGALWSLVLRFGEPLKRALLAKGVSQALLQCEAHADPDMLLRTFHVLANLYCSNEVIQLAWRLMKREKALVPVGVDLLCSCWPRSKAGVDAVSDEDQKAVAEHLHECLHACVTLPDAIKFVCVLSQVRSSALTNEMFESLKLFATNAYLFCVKAGKAEHMNVGLECAARAVVARAAPDDVGLLRLLQNVAALPTQELQAISLLLGYMETNDAPMDSFVTTRLRLSKRKDVQATILRAVLRSPELFVENKMISTLLSMMRRHITEPKLLQIASAAALKLSYFATKEASNMQNLFQLAKSSANDDARNTILCILYRIAVGRIGLLDGCFDEMFWLLTKVSTQFTKPFFQIVSMLLWRMFRNLAADDDRLVAFSNIVAAHFGGNCKRLRELQHRQDAASRPQSDTNALLHVNYEKEIHMFTAVSFKRSLLETSKQIPQPLRGASSIIGFYETESQAIESYLGFESDAQERRSRHLLAPMTVNALPGASQGSTNQESQGDGDQQQPTAQKVNDNVEYVALASRVRILVTMLADLLRLSKIKLQTKHAEQICKLKQDFEISRNKRQEQQTNVEKSLELDEIPASRLAFDKIECLQCASDRDKLLETRKAQHEELCCCFEVLSSKQVISNIFYAAFGRHFDAKTKQIAVWLLWELIFIEHKPFGQSVQGEAAIKENQSLQAKDEQDHQARLDAIEAAKAEAENAPYIPTRHRQLIVHDADARKDLDSDSDDSDDDEGDNDNQGIDKRDDSPKPTGATEVSLRQQWNQRSDNLIFNRPRDFFELRYAAVLCEMASSRDREMKFTAVQLLVRLASLNDKRRSNKSYCSSIAKVRGISVLQNLIREEENGDKEIQFFAMLTLRQLAVSHVHQEIMSSNHGFQLFLDLASRLDPRKPIATTEQRTWALASEILVPLARHPCNATRMYQAELDKGRAMKRYVHKKSFEPAVDKITISSTPRTKGAYKVQLKPLLFADQYPSTISEEQEADQEEKNGEQEEGRVGGPTFVFRANQRNPHSFARYLKEDPANFDEFWQRSLSKFDKTGMHLLQNVPTFEAPDGVKFHLFLQAAVPPQPVFLASARIERQIDLLEPCALEDLCGMLGVEHPPGEDVLLRFCVSDPELLAEGADGRRFGLPPMPCVRIVPPAAPLPCDSVEPAHPLLGHLGADIGQIHPDDIQVAVWGAEDGSSQQKDNLVNWETEASLGHLSEGLVPKAHAALMHGVFKEFASEKGPCMTMADLTKLLHVLKLSPKTFLQDVDPSATIADEQQLFKYLVQVAMDHFRHIIKPAVAFETLVQDHVLANLDWVQLDPNRFRFESYARLPLETIHKRTMLLFPKIRVQGASGVDAAAFEFCVGLTGVVGLPNGIDLTQVRRAFSWSLSPGHTQLGLKEFQEALARVMDTFCMPCFDGLRSRLSIESLQDYLQFVHDTQGAPADVRDFARAPLDAKVLEFVSFLLAKASTSSANATLEKLLAKAKKKRRQRQLQAQLAHSQHLQAIRPQLVSALVQMSASTPDLDDISILDAFHATKHLLNLLQVQVVDLASDAFDDLIAGTANLPLATVALARENLRAHRPQ